MTASDSMVVDDDRLESRARQSLGSSHDVIHRMVADALHARQVSGGHVVDVGCGGGALWRVLRPQFSSYCGIDAVRYDGFPPDGEFRQTDLDGDDWAVDADVADLVVAVETIEHLENPWAFWRGLARMAKPGAWIVVTTPNQLSGLSLGTLIVKQRFSAFQDTHYPTHRTALLPSDLRRLAGESRLEDVAVRYSHHGRLPLLSWHYPRAIARWFPRGLSDNLMLIGRKPRD
jgi:2-polyprenyl-3-methyl-5-hydroxy-6-metoxy-1,4-benzoquinol methylase